MFEEIAGNGKCGNPSNYKGLRDFGFCPDAGGVTRSQTRRDTNFAIPGYSISAMIPRRKEKCKDSLSYHVSPEKATGAHRFSLCAPACSVLPFCPALCSGEGDVGAEQVAVDGQM